MPVRRNSVSKSWVLKLLNLLNSPLVDGNPTQLSVAVIRAFSPHSTAYPQLYATQS